MTLVGWESAVDSPGESPLDSFATDNRIQLPTLDPRTRVPNNPRTASTTPPHSVPQNMQNASPTWMNRNSSPLDWSATLGMGPEPDSPQ